MIKNNEINISEQDWRDLNATYDKEEIKYMISDAIEENSLPMPFRKITEEEAVKDFNKLLELDYKNIICEEKWTTRYDYNEKYPLSELLFKCSNVGNKASDYYQQQNRWMCDSINSPSPYRTWHTEKFRLTLLNALWSLKVKKVDNDTLRKCIGLRKYISSQFRPSAAKAVYNYFEAENVLDFSSGWGDRLCGFMSSEAKAYYGVDPNINLFKKYGEIIKAYNNGKDIRMRCECAENIYLSNKKFDLIFTSPPYFNIERYTQEKNQSWKKYKKLDDWLRSFLFSSLKKAWGCLSENGYMVINISDVYSNHTVNRICDPMNDFIDVFWDSEYVGCYGYQMRKRPQSGALKGKTGKFAEPMWVWRKKAQKVID